MMTNGNLAVDSLENYLVGRFHLMTTYAEFKEQFKDMPDTISTAQAAIILGVSSTSAVRSLANRHPEQLELIDVSAGQQGRYTMKKEQVMRFQHHRYPDYKRSEKK